MSNFARSLLAAATIATASATGGVLASTSVPQELCADESLPQCTGSDSLLQLALAEEVGPVAATEREPERRTHVLALSALYLLAVIARRRMAQPGRAPALA